MAQRAPGAPVPGDPVAPASPAGSPGGAGSGASILPGLLADPLALPVVLTALALGACARRRTWWFPEVAIGPD
ncbi:hypothetical protein [Actinomycetospora chiangmaiensis]|uniref:hypothetical protein n=1 Tax=Actinomycetospora chiangmaiensis TaxID=402650 RepID=UPI0012FAB8E6|nr:hypothetical protein [Actinomycetospora chiangmaiensis]